MAIKVGDQIPSVSLSYMDSNGPQTISTEELFKGKKVVLIAMASLLKRSVRIAT
ncbi:hypothetical protein JOY44_20730 [Phormidium sp. CLA17]|nr:hypothetical protein [Leptolyngbya sp. Cla-17]